MQLPKSQRFPGRGHRVGLVKLLDVVTASGTPAELCPTVRAREGILHVHAEVLLEQRPRFEHLRAEGARERVGRVVARRRRGERRPGRRTGADPLPGSRYDAPHGTVVVRRRLSPCALFGGWVRHRLASPPTAPGTAAAAPGLCPTPTLQARPMVLLLDTSITPFRRAPGRPTTVSGRRRNVDGDSAPRRRF